MNKNIPLAVAGIVFSLVAIAHLSRLILGFNIVIANYHVPLKINLIGLIVALVLAIWMFKAAKK